MGTLGAFAGNQLAFEEYKQPPCNQPVVGLESTQGAGYMKEEPSSSSVVVEPFVAASSASVVHILEVVGHNQVAFAAYIQLPYSPWVVALACSLVVACMGSGQRGSALWAHTMAVMPHIPLVIAADNLTYYNSSWVHILVLGVDMACLGQVLAMVPWIRH